MGLMGIAPMRQFSFGLGGVQQQEPISKELMIARREAHQIRTDIPRGKNRVPYTCKVGDVLHGFRLEQIERIDLFDINAYKLEHLETGA